MVEYSSDNQDSIELRQSKDHAASALETIRNINAASRIIEDMSRATIDDPLFDRYQKLGCTVSPLEKESEEYSMILKYLEKTYEPVKVGEISYVVSVENIFQVEVSAGPSYNEIKRLPNEVLLWCGTRSSNILRPCIRDSCWLYAHSRFQDIWCRPSSASLNFSRIVIVYYVDMSNFMLLIVFYSLAKALVEKDKRDRLEQIMTQ